ncbi:MAG: hypothetical protein MUP31_00970 [Xanthomonadales bacterium]|nr:hypothetical protein [Xanthomonadales bacterium]
MEKYLRTYAEPEVTALDGLLGGLPPRDPWINVLVIPACNESPRFLRPPPPCDGRSLMILVINETDSASSAVSSSNQALAATVRAQFEPQSEVACRPSGSGQDFQLELLRNPLNPRDVLLVDRFSEGRRLPVKGGVGHARKIGADLAAGLIHRRRIQSRWIHCSDADVQLPETYFACSNASRLQGVDYAALVYPFRHGNAGYKAQQQDVLQATQLYELSLRYYVAGLQFAGSPYAFHTIGSTMAVNALHYAKVRGFPRREAGEDFYLLNKLAKVGPVLELEAGPDCEPIEIESRRSDRVPFGTGAAVIRIAGLDDPARDFRFYHPAVFEGLKAWLRSWPGTWDSQSSELEVILMKSEFGDHDSSEMQQALRAGLEKMKAGEALDHAFRQSKDLEQFTRQMHTWFDAFRTLKLIHFLRDHALPSVSYDGLGEGRDFVRRVKETGSKGLSDGL